MILDDVFSGLDIPTSTAISNKIFGSNGLLRGLGTTVVMASHSGMTSHLSDLGLTQSLNTYEHVENSFTCFTGRSDHLP